jgi:ABC-type transport system involved in multi-copper enzyme maturation permease subunit
MIASVVRQEMLLAGRRHRTFHLRWLYAGFLLAQLVPLFFYSRLSWQQLFLSTRPQAFFASFLGQHFLLLALVTPALVAGAITEEKRRGTLIYLLTANLTPLEIILGKLVAGMQQIIILSLPGLPIAAFIAGLSGDAWFPVVVLAVSLPLVFGLAALSLLVSVWSRSTRDAMLCVYALILAGLVPYFLPMAAPSWLERFHPLHVLDPFDPRGERLANFGFLWGAIGVVAVLLASWRLRPAFQRQLQKRTRHTMSWWQSAHPRVRGNPILWREQHLEGIAPVPWLRVFSRRLGMAAVFLAAGGSLLVLQERLFPIALLKAASATVDVFYWHGLGFLLLMTFLVAIRASSAITSEKEHGTWLALVTTPLTTRKILAGKHWGIFWAAWPYVLAYAAAAIPLALLTSPEALAWTLLWIGVTLLAVIFEGAVGLWCSARAGSSWASLLQTIALFYLGWILFLVPITVVLVVVRGALIVALALLSLLSPTADAIAAVEKWNILYLAAGVGLAAAFWSMTESLLAAAATRLERNDTSGGPEFDYYYLVREHQRKLEEQKWESPNMDGFLEPETVPAAEKQPGEERRSRHRMDDHWV